MNYVVKMTDTAKKDFKDIALWVAEQSQSVELAKKFVNELRLACEKLDTFPYGGSIPEDRVLKSQGYRFITCKDYLIFYEIDEKNKTVYILAAFNEKKDYMRVMKKFI